MEYRIFIRIQKIYFHFFGNIKLLKLFIKQQQFLNLIKKVDAISPGNIADKNNESAMLSYNLFPRGRILIY